MPVVRQAIAQWKRWTGAVPPWAVSAVAGFAIFLLLLGLYQYRQAPVPAWEILWNGHRFTDSELGPMLRAFAKEDLTEYAVSNGRVRVPRRDVSKYLAALAEHEALPQGFGANVQNALADSRWFETERDRKRRVSHALDQDLASQIRAMPGIEDATVYYDERDERGFEAKTVYSASVSVVPAEDYLLSREQIHAIRVLVASARPGLEPADVSVTDLGTSRAYAGMVEEVALIPRAEDYLLLKKRVERDWQDKIRHVLQFIPDAQIVVGADLPLQELPVSAPIGQSIEPRRLAVSVSIPESFYGRVWRNKTRGSHSHSQVPTAAELRQLREQYERQVHAAVHPMLPAPGLEGSSVVVTTFDDLATAPQPAWSGWKGWRTSLRTQPAIWLVAVAVPTALLFGLHALRRKKLRRRSQEPETLVFSDYATTDVGEGPALFDPDQQMDERQLRETLVTLVREDPDGAARVLHRWLERAG